MRELVSATGLHENALRRSLSRLVAGGSVHVEPQRRVSRGRPSLRYRRAGAADEPFRQFLPLLLELVDRAPGADADAYEIGRARGAETAASGSAADAVAAVLVTLGFDPRRHRDRASDGTRLTLNRCPFTDAVVSGPRGSRICALHHGLLAGVAEANGGDLQSFTINDPRVRPCELSVR
jgi:predicted ArsR family transcriptional regulator